MSVTINICFISIELHGTWKINTPDYTNTSKVCDHCVRSKPCLVLVQSTAASGCKSTLQLRFSPEPYVSLTTSPVNSNNFSQGVFCLLLSDAVWMQRVGTWGRAAAKAGVGQHGGCCLFDWTCHAFPQSAAGEHLGLAGWCSEATWGVCAGPRWHVRRLWDDKEASVRQSNNKLYYCSCTGSTDVDSSEGCR